MIKTDTVHSQDMMQMIEKIQSFVENVSFSEYQEDTEKQFAVFHALEVIGEAANKLSAVFVQTHPDFPVRQTVELRNFLIHGYSSIKLEVIWGTIQNDLPSLKKQLEPIISAKS